MREDGKTQNITEWSNPVTADRGNQPYHNLHTCGDNKWIKGR